MVQHMMAFEEAEISSPSHREMMGGVVCQVVGEVSQGEAGKERPDPMGMAHYPADQQIEKY